MMWGGLVLEERLDCGRQVQAVGNQLLDVQSTIRESHLKQRVQESLKLILDVLAVARLRERS